MNHTSLSQAGNTFEAFLGVLADLIVERLAARHVGVATSPAHYVNGRSAHLPSGWSVDRFLRWCRERQRDGAVRVETVGKLRRVRCTDLDGWIAAQNAKREDVAPSLSLSDEVARELGLRPKRAKR